MLFLCISLPSRAKGALRTRVCLHGEKGVREGKAEAVSVGRKMLAWADMRDSFHCKIAQR